MSYGPPCAGQVDGQVGTCGSALDALQASEAASGKGRCYIPRLSQELVECTLLFGGLCSMSGVNWVSLTDVSMGLPAGSATKHRVRDDQPLCVVSAGKLRVITELTRDELRRIPNPGERLIVPLWCHTKKQSRERYVYNVGLILIFLPRCYGAMSEVSGLRDVVATLQHQLAECLVRTNESHEGGSREGHLGAEEQVRYRCHRRATDDVAYLVDWKIFRFKRRRGSELTVTL